MSDFDDVRRLAALHRLVDNLPSEALDSAFRVLENLAKWPPKTHSDAEAMLAQARERLITHSQEHAQSTGSGFVTGFGGASSFSPDGYSHSSLNRWEGHTSITVHVHFFRGYELHTTERLYLSEDHKSMIQEIESSLPHGTSQRCTFNFKLS